jgi:hypothetical protein
VFSKETFRYAKEISAVRETSDQPWTEMDPMKAVRELEPFVKRRLLKDFCLGETDANKVIGGVKQKFKTVSSRREAFLTLNAFIDVQIAEHEAKVKEAAEQGITLAELTEKEKRARSKKFLDSMRVTRRVVR